MKSKLLLLGLLGAMAATAFAEEPQPVTGWLLPRGTVDSWTAKYYYSTGTDFGSDGPAADWFQPDFDDSAWDVITGPVGNKNWCNTTWNTGSSSYWLRCEFDMENVNTQATHLFKTVHDDGAVAYLNGQQIFTHNGVCNKEHIENIPSQYFLKGRNVLAVMVNNGVGDAYIDFGITSSDVNFESTHKTITYNGMEFRTSGDEAKLLSIDDRIITTIPETVSYNDKEYTVTSMDNQLFVFKSCIERLSLPASIPSLENIIVDYFCPTLVRLTLNASTPPVIKRHLYADYSNRYLFVPDGSVEAYQAADYWNRFKIYPISVYDNIILPGDRYYQDGICYAVTSTENRTAAVSNQGFEDLLIKTGDISIPASITISSKEYKITEIQSRAFAGWSMKSVYLGDNVTVAREAAFEGCMQLESVTMSDNLTTLESACFNGCQKLANVYLSKNLQQLSNSIFLTCYSLTHIDIPESVTTIGYGAFGDRAPIYGLEPQLKSIFIPKNVRSITDASFCSPVCESIVVDPENPYYDSRDNCNAIIETRSNTLIRGCGKTIIPSTVTKLGHSCFLNVKNMPYELIIPASVQNIESYSFDNGCNVQKLTIPEGITTIESYTFWNEGRALKILSLPSTVSRINSLPTSLSTLTIYAINPPTLGVSNNYEKTVLYCPERSIQTYRNTPIWNTFKEILPIEAIEDFALSDSEDYIGGNDFETKQFTYSRIYKNTNWQTIILPVSLDYEDFCEDFEIAKIYNIIVTQSVEGGDLGDASIQIVKLKEGDYTVPNVPYMIKAKVADSENAQALSKENCVVYRANPQSLECSNTETAFTFTGTYSAISADDLAGYYAMSGGSWYHQTGAAGLKPMRAYMSITSKTGGYNSTVANHAPIRVSVVGEEEAGEVSAIITLTADTNADEGIIIDRQLIGLPVGSYNLRGKKVIVK